MFGSRDRLGRCLGLLLSEQRHNIFDALIRSFRRRPLRWRISLWTIFRLTKEISPRSKVVWHIHFRINTNLTRGMIAADLNKDEPKRATFSPQASKRKVIGTAALI